MRQAIFAQQIELGEKASRVALRGRAHADPSGNYGAELRAREVCDDTVAVGVAPPFSRIVGARLVDDNRYEKRGVEIEYLGNSSRIWRRRRVESSLGEGRVLARAAISSRRCEEGLRGGRGAKALSCAIGSPSRVSTMVSPASTTSMSSTRRSLASRMEISVIAELSWPAAFGSMPTRSAGMDRLVRDFDARTDKQREVSVPDPLEPVARQIHATE